MESVTATPLNPRTPPEAQPATADPSLLRRINSASVLRALRAGGALTVTAAAGATGLSRPTVEAALEDLAGQGLVEELAPEPGEKRMGRPARTYRFRPEAGAVLGLDIGAHKVLAIVADLDGRVLATERAELSTAMPRKERLAAVRACATDCLSRAAVPRSRLWGASAGTVGIVDRGTVTLSTVLPEWTGLNLARELGRSFPCPVTVDNDANLAAVAEHWLGAARGIGDVVYVLAGLRMGAGVLSGGTVHRGHSGAAGEIGALGVLGWQDAPSHLVGTTTAAGMETTVAEVYAAARAGEPWAHERVAAFVDGIALGTAAMALAVDPELIVVGGGTSRSADLIVGPLEERLATLCVRPPRVAASTLGDESVALGAVRTALDSVEARLGGAMV
ncbi:putative NBD/HSP70 family sugar kinase [Catenulispora sp. MAP12-49]|uniref:ROK family transcriptional regulator n=1 Tax=Catenulispora sp. MAP12-49 TaxID=3156302 RepID=UPI00351769F3